MVQLMRTKWLEVHIVTMGDIDQRPGIWASPMV